MNKTNNYLLFFCFSIIFFSFAEPYQYTVPGLDQSWQQSIALAVDQKFVFGKDFIFNYGPLGFLYTSLFPKTVSVYYQFIFHIFVLVCYILIIDLFTQKYPRRHIIIFILSVFAIYPSGMINDVGFTLFFFLVFFILNYHYTQKNYLLPIILIIAVLNFYIKHNVSIASIIAVFIGLIDWLYYKKITIKKAAIFVFSLVVTIFLTSFLLNVSLYNYLLGALNIIWAYPDGMSVTYFLKTDILFFFSYKIYILILLIIILFKKVKLKEDILLIIFTFYFLFIAYKQSVTAYSIGSTFNFFSAIPAIIIILIFYPNLKANTQRIGLLIKITFISLFFIASFIRICLDNRITSLSQINLNNLSQNWNLLNGNSFNKLNPFKYFKKLKEYDYNKNFSVENLSKTKLPADILNIIGSNSIDIVPENISYIYFNQLNYRSRPIIQTYQANSKWLEARNGKKFKNDIERPIFVLANITGFRDQHPYWIDKETYLELLTNYEPLKRFSINNDTIILFKSSSKIKFSSLNLSKSQKLYQLKDTINIPQKDSSLVYFKAKIKLDLQGQIFKFLFQPPQLWCTIIFEDNKIQYFRIPPSLLESGVLVNYHIYTHKDFYEISNKKYKQLKKIKSIVFSARRDFGYSTNFSGQFYTLEPTN